MNKEKINCFGLFTMMCSLTSASIYGIFSSYIFNKSKNASFISLLLGLIFIYIISKIIFNFFIKYPDLSFTNKIKNIFKKYHKIVLTLSILSSLLGYILFTYRLTMFLSTQYLVNTPKFLILLLIIFITFYTSSKGLETTIRVSTITFYISIIIFLFDFFSLVNQVKIDNMLPIINVSYENIIISSILFSFYFTIPITNIFSLNLNQLEDKSKFKKYYYLSLLVSFLIALISITTTIGISGIKINELFDYPIYTLLKRIHLFSFLDSLENISIMLWILFIINTCTMSLLFIFNTTKETFNLTNKKSNIINFILIIITFIIQVFIFFKNNYNESYNYIWIPFSILFIIFMIVLIAQIKDRFN